MKAITLQQPGQFEYTERDLDKASATAGSAAESASHRHLAAPIIMPIRATSRFFSYPRILGHELGVEVVDVGSAVTKVQVGDKCSVEPYLNTNTRPSRTPRLYQLR